MPPKRRNQKGPMMINLDAEDDDQLIVEKTSNEQQQTNQKKLENLNIKDAKETSTSTNTFENTTATETSSETKKIEPVHVDYCNACNLPIEYCEFSDRFETDCIPFLEKHFPEKLKELIELRENDKNKDKKINKKSDSSSSSAPKEGRMITVTVSNRNRRKMLTTITGLEDFNIGPKEFSKTLAKKFSCGAAVVKKPVTGIELHGEFREDIFQLLKEEFGIERKFMKALDEKRRKTREQILDEQAARMLGKPNIAGASKEEEEEEEESEEEEEEQPEQKDESEKEDDEDDDELDGDEDAKERRKQEKLKEAMLAKQAKDREKTAKGPEAPSQAAKNRNTGPKNKKKTGHLTKFTDKGKANLE